CLQYSESPLSF
nr:immunoglobulin light chain junction region [Macaca mulatta]MOV78486.1 immunoglobulin light chain junction region [Macaca mulatta]MOV81233.1 immunoglobulin light chain junction region [Macaca mulatta]MOV81364.1 immunoglobulin light chain junction region [Macaca mulatta]MOV81811.1 immunoglobulin light chain junction region [Macaca mulatta]